MYIHNDNDMMEYNGNIFENFNDMLGIPRDNIIYICMALPSGNLKMYGGKLSLGMLIYQIKYNNVDLLIGESSSKGHIFQICVSVFAYCNLARTNENLTSKSWRKEHVRKSS